MVAVEPKVGFIICINDSKEGSFTRHELAAPLSTKVTRQFTTTRDYASLSNAVPAIPPLLLHRHVISVCMQRPVPCALTLKSSCIIMLQHSRSSSSNSSPLDISSLHSWREASCAHTVSKSRAATYPQLVIIHGFAARHTAQRRRALTSVKRIVARPSLLLAISVTGQDHLAQGRQQRRLCWAFQADSAQRF